jgi:hypothetical protein
MWSLRRLPAVALATLSWAATVAAHVDAAAAADRLPAITRGLRAFWSFGEAPGEPKIDVLHGSATLPAVSFRCHGHRW